MAVPLVPGWIFPVSHLVLSLVEVWTTPSLFRHVMVVPAETVKLAGLNDMELMTTVLGGTLGGGGLVP
jgi:hypothetical protein